MLRSRSDTPLFIYSSEEELYAQRLVAQALGHLRLVAVILAGILKPQLSVRSKSLGQSLPPRACPRARPREAGEAGGEKLLAFVP
jgi:hypothetical protein